MARDIRQEKCTFAVSFLTAVLLFPIILAIAGFIVRDILIGILDQFSGPNGSGLNWLSEGIFVGFIVTVAVLIAYPSARFIYSNMRWKFIDSDVRYCQNCEYDLTGNTSGRCPECGSPVITRPPTDTANGEESTRAD